MSSIPTWRGLLRVWISRSWHATIMSNVPRCRRFWRRGISASRNTGWSGVPAGRGSWRASVTTDRYVILISVPARGRFMRGGISRRWCTCVSARAPARSRRATETSGRRDAVPVAPSGLRRRTVGPRQAARRCSVSVCGHAAVSWPRCVERTAAPARSGSWCCSEAVGRSRVYDVRRVTGATDRTTRLTTLDRTLYLAVVDARRSRLVHTRWMRARRVSSTVSIPIVVMRLIGPILTVIAIVTLVPVVLVAFLLRFVPLPIVVILPFAFRATVTALVVATATALRTAIVLPGTVLAPGRTVGFRAVVTIGVASTVVATDSLVPVVGAGEATRSCECTVKHVRAA